MGVSVTWLLRKAQLLRNQPVRDEQEMAAPRLDAAPAEAPADVVDISSDDSFPASDPPAFTPTSGSVHGAR